MIPRAHITAWRSQAPWYSDATDITVYDLEELLGTKLRALYQRKKGSDLYDLWRVTDGPTKAHVIAGIKFKNSDETELLKDWELLKYLNTLPLRKDSMKQKSLQPQGIEEIRENIDRAAQILRIKLDDLNLDFRVPDIELLSVLWPV